MDVVERRYERYCARCGHWENWHGLDGCEVCSKYRVERVRSQSFHEYVAGNGMWVSGPIGRDAAPISAR